MPLLLVAGNGRSDYVARCCQVAARMSIRPGMPFTQAHAMAPHARMMKFNRQHDWTTLRNLQTWAQQFTPLVTIDPDYLPRPDPTPDGLVLDISGCERLFGGEEKLISLLQAGLSSLGFTYRIAAADTHGAAWALARFAAESVTATKLSHMNALLADLPVAALRISTETVNALSQVGISTIAHIYPIPRSELSSRFDKELITRLDQAMGTAAEVLEFDQPSRPISAMLQFDGPCSDQRAIILATRGMVLDLSQQLTCRQLSVNRIIFTCWREHRNDVHQQIFLSQPRADYNHLCKLIERRVEQVDLSSGIIGMELLACTVARFRQQQYDLLHIHSTTSPNGTALNTHIDLLTNEIGRERVLRGLPVASHIPETAFRLLPAVDGLPPETPTHAPHQPLRPSLLLHHPERVEVVALQPDYPPARLQWRDINSPLLQAFGPERIDPEWWRAHPDCQPAQRDYYWVQTIGGLWLWIFRQPLPRMWFVHGIWS